MCRNCTARCKIDVKLDGFFPSSQEHLLFANRTKAGEYFETPAGKQKIGWLRESTRMAAVPLGQSLTAPP